MKKLILFLLLNFGILAFGTSPGDITYEVKGGVQFNVVLDNVNFLDFEAAKFISLDILKRVSGRLDFGLGAQYNSVETTKDSTVGTLTRLPIYVVSKLHLAQTFPLNPYLKLLAGYQVMLQSDVEGLGGGPYYGIGIGLEVGYFVFDYAFTIEENRGDSEYRGAIGHSLALGYRF